MSKASVELNERKSLVIKFFEDNDIEYDDKNVLHLAFRLKDLKKIINSYNFWKSISDERENMLKAQIREEFEERFNKKVNSDDLLNYIFS